MRAAVAGSVIINILMFLGGYALLQAGLGQNYEAIEIVLEPLELPETVPVREQPEVRQQPVAPPESSQPPQLEQQTSRAAEASAPAPVTPQSAQSTASSVAAARPTSGPNYLDDPSLADLMRNSSGGTAPGAAADSPLAFAPGSSSSGPASPDLPQLETIGSLPSQPTSQPTAAAPGPSVNPTLDAELRRLQSSLSSQFASTSSSQAPASTGPGVQSDQTGGEVSGRGIIRSDRLDVSKYIQRAESNWPAQVTIRIRVNSAGFVDVLNSADFSAYTGLSSAIYRLLQGQVFVANPGVAEQIGTIVFRIR